MTPEKQVARAALDAAKAHQKLEDAIRYARAEGMSLRAIATAAGMSHEQVRRIAP